MRRSPIKSFVKKTLLFLVLLILIAYLSVTWKLKSAVDQFFDSRPGEVLFEYKWVWFDFEGNLFLSDVQLFDERDDHVATLNSVEISLGSLSELYSLKHYVTFQQVPPLLNIKVSNAYTTEYFELFKSLSSFDLPFTEKFLPDSCRQLFSQSPASFDFKVTSQFRFYDNDQILDFDIDLRSLSFANVHLKGKVDNLSNLNFDDGYVSAIQVNANDMLWLQQTLSECREQEKLSKRGQFEKQFVDQVKSLAEQHHYLASDSFDHHYASFVSTPQSLSLSFSPAQGETWRHLSQRPLHEIFDRASIDLSLNEQKIEPLLASVDHLGFLQEQKEKQKDTVEAPVSSYLPVTSNGLRNFIGTQVTLHLKNQSKVKGIIEKIRGNQVYLSEYQFGGRSELPYKLNDISSVEVNPGR